MSFSFVVTVTAVAAFILGVGWLFFAPVLIRRWGMQVHSETVVVGRRLGTAYLGIAIILLLARTAPLSQLRLAISAGLLFAMVVLAMLGVKEYQAKRVNASILISVALEVFLTIGYAQVLVDDLKTLSVL
ncbi:hypothetical protein FE810_06200 [Thalassotalea litorea]|uniref:DUF4345 domain-containing protein n=1 Tax=Thalassotalea litorea TaxID=2020715 RepID=A0A5R9INX5_9GAMM|nr:hypothetical protein [Thalassotalea litorea]TLU66289.1 hypothetical protein FE810_06200 [Thalassotalea litorea]